MHEATDTIAAIATAAGEGAISVVRISGPDSLAIADRLTVCGGAPPSKRAANTFLHGYVRQEGADGGAIADEVVVLVYRAPHSYTCEDSVEIQGHGGAAAARRILRAVLAAGARAAEPGEFTKRAFLNGRIDLLQAEAVLDVIRARSDRAAAAAMEQLTGKLSRSFGSVYDDLMSVAADLEATLDFSEDELPSQLLSDVGTRLKGGREALRALIGTWDEGHLLREGALVAILGRPNVGKSTLLNAMLGTHRAIVTDTPGTTRDVIEESMVLAGVAIRLADTAGLRDTECQIEGEGIRRALGLMERADYVLYVVDASQPVHKEDVGNISQLAPARTVIVLNKCDQTVTVDDADLLGRTVIKASMKEGWGLKEVKEALLRKLLQSTGTPPHAVISERHRQLAQVACDELDQAIALAEGAEADTVLAAARVRSALESLGLITGRTYYDELLEAVFARFCIGK